MPEEPLAIDPRAIWCVNYGLTTFAELFTHRQLVALTTFSNLVGEARERIARDGEGAGRTPNVAEAYADAVALYLAFAVDKFADRNSTICAWESGMGRLRGTFQRQALPMSWDFAEANVFGRAGGDFAVTLVSELEVIERMQVGSSRGVASQRDSRTVASYRSVVSTDPPYYDNIGYADLSDFFYVWLRRSLATLYSHLTGTMLTPRTEELVATPYRWGGSKAKAQEHFERGFILTFSRLRASHRTDIPMTVFYAFKQAETDLAGTVSTGWERMLNGLIEAGWCITATWPVRAQLGTRSIGRGANALASSIVLVCRPRSPLADAVIRRAFIAALKKELPGALKELQQGSVAPVDLAQAAIGPGMAVFSRYSKVVEADGSDMTVRTALAVINHVLDEVLAEQEGDFDADTRFCIKWFGEFGWNEASSGQADVLARATNTSVAGLMRGGIFRAVAGKAQLLAPDALSAHWDPLTDERVSDWEIAVRLAKALDESGAETAANLMAGAGQRRDLDTVKELAYLLYSICERRGWTQAALLFNGLGTSWNDLEAVARRGAVAVSTAQGALDFDDADSA